MIPCILQGTAYLFGLLSTGVVFQFYLINCCQFFLQKGVLAR